MNFPGISRRLAPTGASLKMFSQLLFLLKRISPMVLSGGLIQGTVIIHLSEKDCKFNIRIL